MLLQCLVFFFLVFFRFCFSLSCYDILLICRRFKRIKYIPSDIITNHIMVVSML